MALGGIPGAWAGSLDPGDVLLAVPVAVEDNHAKRRLEPRLGLFQQAFLEPASLCLLVLEDQYFVGGRLQQGVLGRLDRVGIANLPGGFDAVRAELLEHTVEPGLRFSLGLIDVTQRVPEGARLDCGNHHPQVDLITSVLGAGGVNLTQRLRAERVAGDYCKQPVRHRSLGSIWIWVHGCSPTPRRTGKNASGA